MVRNNSKAPPLEVAMYGGMACKESLDKDKKVLSHQDQMRDLFSTIKRGGSGDQINGPWKANPTPFDNPIDLEDFSIHNILGFHFSILKENYGLYISTGERVRFFGFGKNSDTVIDLSTKYAIILFVTGTHKFLTGKWKDIAERRQKIWKFWATGDSRG